MPRLKIAKIENCQNWKLLSCSITKLLNCQFVSLQSWSEVPSFLFWISKCRNSRNKAVNSKNYLLISEIFLQRLKLVFGEVQPIWFELGLLVWILLPGYFWHLWLPWVVQWDHQCDLKSYIKKLWIISEYKSRMVFIHIGQSIFF